MRNVCPYYSIHYIDYEDVRVIIHLFQKRRLKATIAT